MLDHVIHATPRARVMVLNRRLPSNFETDRI